MKISFICIKKDKSIGGEIDGRKMARMAFYLAPIILTGADIGAAEAASKGTDMATRIEVGSQPIKDLLTGLADPVCFVVFAWGILECMLGKSASGITRMKYAALGFVGMQYIDDFMDML